MKIGQFSIRRHAWIFVAILCTALWGSAAPTIKLAYSHFDIDTSNTFNLLLFAGVRFFGSGVMTLALSRFVTRQTPTFNASLVVPTLMLALTQTILQYLFFFIGISVVSGVTGALLSSTASFFAVIFAAMLGIEILTGRKIVAIILGLFGIFILNLGHQFDFQFRLNGELMMLLSAVFNAVAALLMKRYSQQHEPVALTAYQFLLGGVVLALVGYGGGGRLSWPGFSKGFALIYLMLVSAIGFGLWSLLLKKHDISKVVAFLSLVPFFGALTSWILLNENIWRWQTMVALLVISAGIVLLNTVRKHNKRSNRNK